tara:strand:- start:20623 stop:22146 length:1524 start_codon:yes stop_codon:yes gene_type:complete
MLRIEDFIVKKCTEFPSNVFIINEDGVEITYNDFLIQHQNAKEYYRQIIPTIEGFSFSIIADNSPNFLYSLFALQSLSGAAVNLNPNLSLPELLSRLKMAEVEVLVCGGKIYEQIQEIDSELELKLIFLIDEDVTEFNCKMYAKSSKMDLAATFTEGGNAFIQFTGGSSGVNKAALISHRNVLSNIDQLQGHFTSFIDLTDLRVLIAFPFYHIFAVVFNLMFFMNNGGTVILYRELRDLEGVALKFTTHKINFTVGVNTWYKKLMQLPSFKSRDFSNLRACIAGGEYVPLSTKHAWRKLTGRTMFSGYGLTETTSLCIVSPLSEEENLLDTLGIPIPSTQTAIISDKNELIKSDGVQGELLIKGPQVLESYFNSVESDSAFFKSWFRTGDIVERVQGKYFKLVDRKKEMISVSGNKVYPNEVEEIILSFSGVIEVGVIGIASEKTGEEVVAFIVLDREANINEEDILSFCKKQMTAFKVPRKVFLKTELPKTPIGKTSKTELRKLLN